MRYLQADRPFSADWFLRERTVRICGVDSATMTLKALRETSYPEAFLASLHRTYAGVGFVYAYTGRYRRFLAACRRYPLSALWSTAMPTGSFESGD